MATDVTMPRLSDSMEEGTVLKWIVEEGGEVKRGEPLVEIETDKANMTYEADTDGVLVEVVAKEGDTLAIGEVIARIGEAGEAKAGGEEKDEEPETEEPEAEERPEEAQEKDMEPEAEPEPEPEPEEKQTATATAERPSSSNGAGDGERVKASPVARRMARELGVELARLEGSGPGGRIVKADVQAAADGGETKAEPDQEAPEKERGRAEPARGEAGAKGEVDVHELTRLQQTVTRRMAESKATAPDFALTVDVDMSGAVALRERLKEVAEHAPSFNDMVVKAAATALTEHPKVNGAYRDGKFELYGNVNVGVAVAAQDALVVPTIFDADQKSLGAIAREARRLIERVREKQVTPPELSGGTFTVSNLGMFGIDHFTAIINPPQAAILTVGALAKKPTVDERGRVVAREQMTLTLVCDHRILYGADGAQFLARVKELLEQPLSLAL
jgi:pyruvate dehydrogenase E2 component (dihydrolipoamide acetyltransferase)